MRFGRRLNGLAIPGASLRHRTFRCHTGCGNLTRSTSAATRYTAVAAPRRRISAKHRRNHLKRMCQHASTPGGHTVREINSKKISRANTVGLWVRPLIRVKSVDRKMQRTTHKGILVSAAQREVELMLQLHVHCHMQRSQVEPIVPPFINENLACFKDETKSKLVHQQHAPDSTSHSE